MGWLIGWDSKAEVVAHLLAERDENHVKQDHALVGNVLYVVYRRADKGYRYIAVFLIGTDGSRGARNWGYKDMDEGMGPCYYTCPERLLAQSDVNEGYAPKWREQCREARKAKGGNKAFIASLKKGDRFMYGDREVEFLYRYANKSGQERIAGSPVDKGGTYRYSKNKIEPMNNNEVRP